MRDFLKSRTDDDPDAYLFADYKGVPILYNHLLAIVKSLAKAPGIPYPSKYLGHSFRAVGATELSRAGVPSHHIKLLGQWLSDAYELYVYTDPVELAARAKRMVQ